MNKLLPIVFVAFLVGCGTSPVRHSSASDAQMNDLVMYAMSLADTPYHFGGNNAHRGFDCSGYVGHVYRHELKISLPRTSKQISRVGEPLNQRELRPGDLVFYNTLNQPFSHVGIYIGDGKFVHSPKSGDRIRVEQMKLRYWQTRYNGARRIR
ncbi:MAG: C40 family peptidase [Sideroxyarcus sp.]|nr:C40 family peptidase [Sideroxyarcus sp.]